MSSGITIEGLKVAYPKHEVLKGVELHFEAQQVNGLVGMNGSGKTTLLRTIFGLKDKQAGSIICDGQELKSNQIAYLETENYFYPKMKGREYLELFKLKNPEYDPLKWNALFDLPLNKLVDEYSTGMKKKLALLGVLALDRPILMLDEPFNGVDLESNEKIKLVLKRLKEEGKTIIITSHIIDSLLSLADNISILHAGSISITAPRYRFSEINEYLTKTISENAQGVIDEIFGNK